MLTRISQFSLHRFSRQSTCTYSFHAFLVNQPVYVHFTHLSRKINPFKSDLLNLPFISGDLKRRHSWSSEVDYQPAETEAVTTSGGDPAVPSDDDRISYKVFLLVSLVIPLLGTFVLLSNSSVVLKAVKISRGVRSLSLPLSRRLTEITLCTSGSLQRCIFFYYCGQTTPATVKSERTSPPAFNSAATTAEIAFRIAHLPRVKDTARCAKKCST